MRAGDDLVLEDQAGIGEDGLHQAAFRKSVMSR